MRVHLSLSDGSPSRALPVIRDKDGLALWTSIYNKREPDDLTDEEMLEVIALVATGRYRFTPIN
jgi:hypothetical protein